MSLQIRSFQSQDLARLQEITVASFEGVSIDRNIEARFGLVAVHDWKERKAHDLRLAKEKAEFQAVADRIASLRYIAPRKVGENDALYGSVTSGDIAEFLKAKGVEIDKRKVQLEEPIKKLGEHEVAVKLHPEVSANLRVLVTKEG